MADSQPARPQGSLGGCEDIPQGVFCLQAALLPASTRNKALADDEDGSSWAHFLSPRYFGCKVLSHRLRGQKGNVTAVLCRRGRCVHSLGFKQGYRTL